MKIKTSNCFRSLFWTRNLFFITLISVLLAGRYGESYAQTTGGEVRGSEKPSDGAGAIGTGWVDITSVQEKQQRIQLENYAHPSLDNISTIWYGRGTVPYFMKANFDTASVFNSDMTVGYVYNPANRTHTHTLYKFPGNRSEIRISDNYTEGARQFEGYVTINDKLFGSAVFQLFGSETGATQMQIRGDSRTAGGKLYVMFDQSKKHSEMSREIATGINNKELRINVIHLQEDVGNRVYVYVNGVEKFWFEDDEKPGRGNYMKYGCYGRENNPATNDITGSQVQWRNVRLWKGDGNVKVN